MQCPTCQTAMSEIPYEGMTIHSCDSCGGEFIEGTALSHIVRTRDERVAAPGEVTARKPVFGIPEQESRRQIDCPQCASAMTVGNYGLDSGVFIDRCDSCDGIWLDQNELEHIQALSERREGDDASKMVGTQAQLDLARNEMQQSLDGTFKGSRFAFVNAIMNRLLDAA